MADIGRRGVLRAGLAFSGAGALAGCGRASRAERVLDSAGVGSSPVLPGSPLVAAAESARPTTGRVRSRTLALTSGMVDLGGVMVDTWSYGGTVPGPVIRVGKGDIVRATFANHVADPTTTHWHGVGLRNDMDGTVLTQRPIAPGARFTYEFKASEPGTYWYHPHVGTQQDRGLYGLLIVDDPAEAGDYDAEWLVVLDDWIDGVHGYTPDKVLAELRKGMGGMDMGGGSGGMGDMPGMDMGGSSGSGVMLSGAKSPLLGGDAGDVKYPHYLINGRVPAAPHVFVGKPGQRVRIRILNAGADTAFRVALGGHHMTVTHTDGRPCQPVRTRSLLLGMAERYDVTVTLGDGTFPLVAEAEGKHASALAVVKTGMGAMPGPGDRPAELSATPVGYHRLRPAVPAAPAAPDRDVTVRLTGSMNGYTWGFNGHRAPMARLAEVRQRQRVRVTWKNTTTMWHPMHIHGHTFRVNGAGPLKDTVIVLPGQAVSCDFETGNPGQWMAHCHNVYHEQSGMMGVIGYVS